MRLVHVRDRAKEAIDRLTERLLKQFPDNDGLYGVVFGQGPDVDMGSKQYRWPPEDTRPDFVKADDEGWVRIINNKR